jgi:hypothetical protein
MMQIESQKREYLRRPDCLQELLKKLHEVIKKISNA